MPTFRVAKGVSFRSEQPQMARAERAVLRAFFRRGLDVVLTSFYRPPKTTAAGDETLHDEGLAGDYDTTVELDPPTWVALRKEIALELGPEYQVFAHDAGSGMHIHVEFDPPWRN